MRRPLLPLLIALALTGCSREAPAPADAPPPAATSPAPDAAPVVSDAPPADAPTPGQVPRAFLCKGNEPFWSLDIGTEAALLKTPDAEIALDGSFEATASGAFRFEGAPADSPGETIAALITPAQCFDTMADGPAMAYSVEADLPGGQRGSGCCTAEFGLDLNAAPVFDPAGKPADDWSRLWPDLAEAIARCSEDAGVATDVVTKAWPMNQGKAGVRLRDAGMDRFDCTVDLGSGKIEGVQKVEPTDTLPGEGQPLWIPARLGPPVLDCGRAERVMVGGDAVVGYLHYPEGCG